MCARAPCSTGCLARPCMHTQDTCTSAVSLAHPLALSLSLSLPALLLPLHPALPPSARSRVRSPTHESCITKHWRIRTTDCLSCAPTVCPAPSARAPVTVLAEALRTHVRFGAPAPAPGTLRAAPRPRPLSTVTTAAAGFALLVRWLCTKEGLGVRATPAAAPAVPAAVGCSPAWVATAAFPPTPPAAAAAGEDARDSVTTRSLAGRQHIRAAREGCVHALSSGRTRHTPLRNQKLLYRGVVLPPARGNLRHLLRIVPHFGAGASAVEEGGGKQLNSNSAGSTQSEEAP